MTLPAVEEVNKGVYVGVGVIDGLSNFFDDWLVNESPEEDALEC
jgi:hypothetical protein